MPELSDLQKAIASASEIKTNHEALEKLVRESVVPLVTTLQRDIQTAQGNRYEEGAAQIERDFVVNREDGTTPVIKGALETRRDLNRVQSIVRLFPVETDDDDDPGLLTSKARNDWHLEVQRTWDRIVFIRSMVNADRSELVTRKLRKRLLKLFKQGPPAIAKAFADTAALGADFIPDVMSAAYLQDVRNEAIIAALFPTIAMGDKNIQIPWMGFGVTPYIKNQIDSNNPAQFRATDIPTSQRTMTAKGLAVRSVMDDDANEDSIVAFAQILMADHARALADGTDDVILNGQGAGSFDTLTAFNPQSRWATAGLGSSGDHRNLIQNGLRRRAITVLANTAATGTVTAPMVLGLRAKLGGGHGSRVDGHALIVSVKGLIKLMATEQVHTVDKIGDDATIRTGELLTIYGTPIKVTDFMSDALETTGKYTAGSGGKGSMLYVATKRFVLGNRKATSVETQRDITRGATDVVSTKRFDFISVDGDSGESSKNVAAEINTTV